jgi:hypothetical protein
MIMRPKSKKLAVIDDEDFAQVVVRGGIEPG